MANQFLKLRRSAVPGRIPSTSSLDFGEIALNTYDGLAFMKKSGSSGEQIVTLGSGAGNVTATGSAFFIPIFNTTSSLATSSIFQSGSFTSIGYSGSPEDPNNPDILYIRGAGIPTYNLLTLHGDLDNYIQLNIQNYNTGTSASADIVATANNGTETTGYVDMGINNGNYINNGNGVGTANDAYLYSIANNLLIGNATADKKIILFAGGLDASANARVFIDPGGTVSINTSNITPDNPEALYITATNNLTYNLITAESNVNNYSQINVRNLNAGGAASSDFVATADNGSETRYFIDMGINSSQYAVPNAVGGPNDAYIYSTGRHLHIGNAGNNEPGYDFNMHLFTGGSDVINNTRIFISGSGQVGIRTLNPQYDFDVSGSARITNGLTASLYGTSSWALNALTASSADNFTVRGTLTAQTLIVQTITSSVDFVTGSTRFGSNVTTNTHQFTGSVSITGSLNASIITGSLFGTASWSQNALTASYVAAANVVGLSLFQIATGSVTASVGVGPNDLFLIKSGSTTYFNISSSGDTTISTNKLVVQNLTTQQPVLTVSQSVIQFATQSSIPTGTTTAGSIVFTSSSMYIGLE